MKRAFTAIGTRIKDIAIAAVHGLHREKPWEDGVLQNARNLSRLIDEIGRERTNLASINDTQGVVEVDRVLSHLQHNITRQVREIVNDPKSPRFAEALRFVLLADEQIARIKGLGSFSREIQSKIDPVDWLSMRAAVYTELTDGMKRDATRYIPSFNIDEMLAAPVTTAPAVSASKPADPPTPADQRVPNPAPSAEIASAPAPDEQSMHVMDIDAAPEPTPDDLVAWHDGEAQPVNMDDVTRRGAYEHYLY